MKKVLLILLVCAFVVILTIIFRVLRDRAENTHDVPLMVGQPTTSKETVVNLAKNCTLSTLPKELFARGVIGLSDTPWPPEAPKFYEKYRDLGVSWARVNIDWRLIEMEDVSYDLSSSDILVRNSQAEEISLLANLIYQPVHIETWDLMQERFNRFARAVAERYKPDGIFAKENGWKDYGISYWEIFNEPNLPNWGWLDKNADPREYVGEYSALLAVGNKAIHAVDPKAVIVLGGVSSDDVHGMPYPLFFNELFSYGVASCFDILAFHPYGKDGMFKETANELRDIMRKNGVEEKPIWFNEYGTPDDTELEKMMRAMLEEEDAVDAWFWFTLRDLRPNKRWNYGLTDYEFSPKPVYFILKERFSKPPAL